MQETLENIGKEERKQPATQKSMTFEEFAAGPKVKKQEYKKDPMVDANDINKNCTVFEIKEVQVTNGKTSHIAKLKFDNGEVKSKWLHVNELVTLQNNRNAFVIRLVGKARKYINIVSRDEEVAAFVN